MDTVIFRLHNVREHYPIIWQLCQQTDEGKLLVVTRAPVPAEVVDTVQKFYLNYPKQTAQPIKFSNQTNVPSSNHNIPYWVDAIGNYLEINVSIPKYLFGNNVLEVVTPPMDKNYSVNQLSPYHHVNFWYGLMKEIANNLIHSIAKFNHVGIDWNDLEVARIDFAVCQVFQTKVFALKQLRYQGGISKKHQRKDATGRQISYEDQTLFFPSEHYSVKIYHKGSEFQRIQAKKIIQLNRERKAQALEKGTEAMLLSSNVKYSAQAIQQLQDYSDRMLRYEFTFRPGYMSYIFNRRINKFWSRHFESFKKIFDYLDKGVDNKKFLLQHQTMYVDAMGYEVSPEKAFEKKYYVVDNIEIGFEGSGHWKTIKREFTDKEYLYMRVLRKHGIVDRKDLSAWLKFMTKELNQTRQFRWKIEDERDTTIETKYVDGEKDILYKNTAMTKTPRFCRFSKTLMRFMLTELEKFFNNFQIDQKPAFSEFMDKIEKHNLLIKDKMLNSSGAALKLLEAQYIHPRTHRALLEFNNLYSKLSMKTIKGKYTKTSYHRLLKLHKLISGQKFQIADAYFGEVNKNFNMIYKELHSEFSKGYLLKMYNTAFDAHYSR